jgi:hypothetical protein
MRELQKFKKPFMITTKYVAKLRDDSFPSSVIIPIKIPGQNYPIYMAQ